MTTDTVDRLVADYMARLSQAANQIPAPRRAELLEQINAHIESARAAGSVDDEAGVRTVLDRLGEPAEIVAAARDNDDPGEMPVVLLRQPRAGLEIAAFGMLTLGSFVPVIGWLIAVVLLWSSRRWRLWEKVLATLVVPGGPGLILFALVLPAQVCTSTSTETPAGFVDTGPATCTGFAFPPAVGVPLFLFVLIGPFIVAGVLLHRAVARAATEPLIPVRSWWSGREIAAVSLLGPGSILLPVLAPVIGLVCAWSSTRWSRRNKALASATTILPSALVLIGYVATSTTFGVGAVLGLVAAVVIGPIIAAVYLALAFSNRVPEH